MPELSNKLETFTDSVIRRMTRICMKSGAINLSQGFPAFEPPQEVKDALERISQEGPHQYTPTFGSPKLRAKLAEVQGKKYGRTIDPETEVIITCGGTEAMMSAMMAVCNAGDKVIVFSPFYENYGADAILSGAEPIYVPLTPPDYMYDKEVLEEAFKQNAKALILCNPSNPTGKVFSRRELEEIAQLAVKYDTFVITDEVYEHIIYKPYHHTYMASLPGMYERTISTSSFSKTYSVTGWRLGYVIGPERIIEGVKKVHDFLTIGAPAPLQEAACTALSLPDSYYEKLLDTYTRKRKFFCDGLDRIGLKHNLPMGSYFVMVDISDFLELGRFRGWSDLEFCEWLAYKVGVGAVPGSSFFKEDVNYLIRLHFARDEKLLAEVLRRLEKLSELLQ